MTPQEVPRCNPRYLNPRLGSFSCLASVSESSVFTKTSSVYTPTSVSPRDLLAEWSLLCYHYGQDGDVVLERCT